MKLQQLEAPKLNTQNAFAQLGQYMQDKNNNYLNRQESIRQHNDQMKQKDAYMNFLNTKKDNAWKMFEFDKMQQQNKEAANTQVLKATRPDIYANIGQEYGQTPSIENANKMNAVTGNIDINAVKPQKVTYETFKGTSADGKPTMYTIDSNGNIKNTGVGIYQKPKQLSTEERNYYEERTNSIKNRNKEYLLKILTQSPNYINAPENIQQQAIEQLTRTGQLPIVAFDDGGWFGGDSYSVVNYAGPIANKVNDVNYVKPGNQAVLNGTPVQNKPMQSLQDLNQSINAIGNIDTSYENKTYSDRNTRELVKAKEWAKNGGYKYFVNSWFPSNEEYIQNYQKYGKDEQDISYEPKPKHIIRPVPLTKEQEKELIRKIDSDMQLLMH